MSYIPVKLLCSLFINPYASKREVGETVLYTSDTPGLVFIIAHCARAIPGRGKEHALLLACHPLKLLARRAFAMLGRSRSPKMPCFRLETVEPPITDPPNSGPPLYNGPRGYTNCYSRRPNTFSALE